ncbi:hypothetical protein, partial [Enterococcus faecalis]|uniref:hypothetical protein n=1 Tax=Enterococcus faecalis TaxID=1351 RepID=UPI0039889C61
MAGVAFAGVFATGFSSSLLSEESEDDSFLLFLAGVAFTGVLAGVSLTGVFAAGFSSSLLSEDSEEDFLLFLF